MIYQGDYIYQSSFFWVGNFVDCYKGLMEITQNLILMKAALLEIQDMT
jgi:hypothetical protein